MTLQDYSVRYANFGRIHHYISIFQYFNIQTIFPLKDPNYMLNFSILKKRIILFFKIEKFSM